MAEEPKVDPEGKARSHEKEVDSTRSRMTSWVAGVEHGGADGEGDTSGGGEGSIATRCWRYHNCRAS